MVPAGTLTTGKPAVQQVVFVTDGMPEEDLQPSAIEQQKHQGIQQQAPLAAAPVQTDNNLAAGIPSLGSRQRALLALIAAVEEGSEHPLAKAVVQYVAQQGITTATDASGCIDQLYIQPGRGVRCHFRINGSNHQDELLSNGVPDRPPAPAHLPAAISLPAAAQSLADVVIGNLAWLQECGIEPSAAVRQRKAQLEGQGATVVLAAVNGEVVMLAAIADQIKREAPAVLKALQQRGMQCWMITGDSRFARLSLQDCFSNLC